MSDELREKIGQAIRKHLPAVWTKDLERTVAEILALPELASLAQPDAIKGEDGETHLVWNHERGGYDEYPAAARQSASAQPSAGVGGSAWPGWEVRLRQFLIWTTDETVLDVDDGATIDVKQMRADLRSALAALRPDHPETLGPVAGEVKS
jgi:hypothetical protein